MIYNTNIKHSAFVETYAGSSLKKIRRVSSADALFVPPDFPHADLQAWKQIWQKQREMGIIRQKSLEPEGRGEQRSPSAEPRRAASGQSAR